MRALKTIREVPSRLDGSFETLLAQFSATTLELNPSLGTAEFARRLTTRAAEMLGARGVLLAWGRGGKGKTGGLGGPAVGGGKWLQGGLPQRWASRQRF